VLGRVVKKCKSNKQKARYMKERRSVANLISKINGAAPHAGAKCRNIRT
jgi:hypothetical protein